MPKYKIEPVNKKSVEQIIHWVKDDDPEISFWESTWWRWGSHIIVNDTLPNFEHLGDNEEGILINDDTEFPDNESWGCSDVVSTSYFVDEDFDEEFDENDDLIADFKENEDERWEAVENRIVFYGPLSITPYEEE